MSNFEKTSTNQVMRKPKRGHYDHETVYEIVDASPLCHVGFIDNGQPFVIPTLHARLDNEIILHGATTSRLMKYAAAGNDLCITVTLLDGIVLARAVMNHSMNYRSAVLFGQGREVTGDEKMVALETVTEKVMPGRWADARQPNPTEMKATAVVAIPVNLASAKIRTGPPGDDEEDYALPIWAGVIPMRQQFLAPKEDPRLIEGISMPNYVADFLTANS
ncbi:MAG: pyridoxamine 5'-phosphate oxidase family protein [Okeania sp. SIO3B3]|nr:pyridoxamine 5'-phosphate oxidase family protein [Okeania sp. SIO3B3]